MVYPTYPTVLPRHELTGPECTNEPEWFKRRDVRAPKPFLQRLIDAQLEPLKDELHFTRQPLFENEGLGHFLERLQTAEQKELSAREKVWEAVERAVAAQEAAASAETKLVRLRVKAAAWKGELDQVRVEKERLEGKNAQLQGRLATVSRAFRILLVAARREGPKQMGKRGGKASRKPSSAPKGVEKRRSKAARKNRLS